MSDRIFASIIITITLIYLLGVGATQNFLGDEWGLICTTQKDAQENSIRVCRDPGDGVNALVRISISLTWPVALPIIAGARITD